uniref:DUF4773 domain-containing protein n=1 Tax=Globodera rostochiensis TaxID=31243 RepID=A0A914I7Q1_GLORO
MHFSTKSLLSVALTIAFASFAHGFARSADHQPGTDLQAKLHDNHHNGTVDGYCLEQIKKAISMRLEKGLDKNGLPLIQDGVSLSGDCSCEGPSCECCGRAIIDGFSKHFDINLCVNATIMPNTADIRLIVTIDGHSIFNRIVKILSNTCVPFVGAKFCITFADVTIIPFSGCVDVDTTLLFIDFDRQRLGCFNK